MIQPVLRKRNFWAKVFSNCINNWAANVNPNSQTKRSVKKCEVLATTDEQSPLRLPFHLNTIVLVSSSLIILCFLGILGWYKLIWMWKWMQILSICQWFHVMNSHVISSLNFEQMCYMSSLIYHRIHLIFPYIS